MGKRRWIVRCKEKVGRDEETQSELITLYQVATQIIMRDSGKLSTEREGRTHLFDRRRNKWVSGGSVRGRAVSECKRKKQNNREETIHRYLQ